MKASKYYDHFHNTHKAAEADAGIKYILGLYKWTLRGLF